MRLPVRSDARKRRELLLDAAAEVFAAQGYGAPLDSIAARAGVGQGTLYRNFADRDELLFALQERDLTEMEATLRDTDLADRPLAVIEAMAEHSVVNPAMCEYWTALPAESPQLVAAKAHFFSVAGRGLDQAKAAGRIREDLTEEDIGMIGVMFRAIRLGSDEAERRQAKQRALALLMKGIVP
jgi:AcrR family transcriptional regulator